MGNNISYDSSKLIAELRGDILEFGNFELKAIFFLYQDTGVKVYTDYDFLDKDVYTDPKDALEAPPIQIKRNESFRKMKAKDLLDILIDQDDIL